MTNFFVNTASTPGGDGSTNGTAGANRAFASLREAITSSNTHISDARTIFCSGTAADTLNVTQLHWNTIDSTPTNYILIVGDTTTYGIWNTSAYRMEQNAASCIYNNNPGHVRFFNVQFKITNGDNNTHCCRLSTANVGSGRTDNDCRIYNCLMWCPDGGNAAYNSEFASGVSPANGLMRLWNNISIGGNFGAASNPGITNYDNTVVGAVSGFEDAQVVINCIAVGCSAADYNNVGTGGGLSTNNVSSDGTAPNPNERTGTPTFVNPGSNNYLLSSSDTVAKGFGVSNPASGLFLDDITGTTRSGAWDIGASQHASGVTITLNATNLNATTITVG